MDSYHYLKASRYSLIRTGNGDSKSCFGSDLERIFFNAMFLIIKSVLIDFDHFRMRFSSSFSVRGFKDLVSCGMPFLSSHLSYFLLPLLMLFLRKMIVVSYGKYSGHLCKCHRSMGYLSTPIQCVFWKASYPSRFHEASLVFISGYNSESLPNI